MDFSAVCRTCLKTSTLNPIFVDNYDYSSYSNAIFLTSGIKVTPDDGLPQQMCVACINFLNQSLIFRKKCKHIETELMKHKAKNDFLDSEKSEIINASQTTVPPFMPLTEESDNIEQRSKKELKVEDIEDDNIKLEYIGLEDNDEKPLKYLVAFESESSNDNDTSDGNHVNKDTKETTNPHDNNTKYKLADKNKTNIFEKVKATSVSIQEEKHKRNIIFEKVKVTADSIEIPYEIDITADPKANRVVCRICRMSLSIRSIDAHMESQHPGQDVRKVKCDLCEKSLLRNKLNRHMQLAHGVNCEGSESYKCGYCRTVFDDRNQLITHVLNCTAKKKKRKNTNREMAECDECHKTMQKASLRMHKAIKHAGLGPVCEHCGVRFGNKFRLLEHCRAKHGYAKFTCSFCDFQSAGAMAMRNHERRHRGEKPFVCESCGAKFHAAYLLAQHKQSHRTERLLKCDICAATFKANNSLHMHKITCHSGALYKCSICPRTYSCRHYVVKHLRHFHQYQGPVGHLDKVPKVKGDQEVASNDE